MDIKRSSNRSWSINGQITNCRTSVKSMVMRDYFARNHINPASFCTLPPEEFKTHMLKLKSIYKQLGLE